MTNKKLGNDFESEFSEILANHGFWVHLLTQNSAGQPADVIAVKNGKAYLIDCKHCAKDKFPLSRIEENQDLAMQLWKECGNDYGWFALALNGEVYMLSHAYLKVVSREKSTVTSTEIITNGFGLNEWVEMTERKKQS